MNDQEFIIWFAGFFEGEGTISFGTGKRETRYISISVAQRQGQGKEWLIRVVKMYGGYHYERKLWNGGWQPMNYWQIRRSNDALAFLVNIRPYFITKERIEKADRAIEFLSEWILARTRFPKPYSEEDIKFIEANFQTMLYEDIARNLNRSRDSISKKINDLGLRKIINLGRSKLTQEDAERIRDKYSSGNFTQRELAKECDLGYNTIRRILRIDTYK